MTGVAEAMGATVLHAGPPTRWEARTASATFTVEHENRLYAYLRPPDILLFTRLGLLLGIRAGQLISLRWEYWQRQVALLVLPKFKRHPARTLPLPHEAQEILRFLHQQQRQPVVGWVFPANKRPQMHANYRSWYRLRFLPALRAARLAELGPNFHSTRHTWATELGSANVPARVLQLLGGWSSLAMVERYTRPALAAMIAGMAHSGRGGNQVVTAILVSPPTASQVLDVAKPRARSSMDRAPDYGSGGCRFKSCRAHQRVRGLSQQLVSS